MHLDPWRNGKRKSPLNFQCVRCDGHGKLVPGAIVGLQHCHYSLQCHRLGSFPLLRHAEFGTNLNIVVVKTAECGKTVLPLDDK
jgi:hypothetical protein